MTLPNLKDCRVQLWHLFQLCLHTVFDPTATPPGLQHRIMCVLKKGVSSSRFQLPHWVTFPTECSSCLMADLNTAAGGATASKQLEVTCQQSGSKGSEARLCGLDPRGFSGNVVRNVSYNSGRKVWNFDLVTTSKAPVREEKATTSSMLVAGIWLSGSEPEFQACKCDRWEHSCPVFPTWFTNSGLQKWASGLRCLEMKSLSYFLLYTGWCDTCAGSQARRHCITAYSFFPCMSLMYRRSIGITNGCATYSIYNSL